MPMRIDDKKVAVEELKDIANKATSAVAADYHGASVTELTKLRKDARDTSVHLKVIRNTLAKKHSPILNFLVLKTYLLDQLC